MHDRNGITLAHLDRLTDPTGLIQHAIYSLPRRESGYTTDDNARALRLCTQLWCQDPSEQMLDRVTGYLSFLQYAHRPGGGFHNFMSYERHWLDAEGGGDCQGQAVRALAEVLGSHLPDDHRALARELIEALVPTLADLRSIRAQSYVILAWGHLWATGATGQDALENVAWSAAQRLVECYQRALRPDWQWFESRMTYANAVLPQALFVAARRWPNEPFLEVAETSFDFLDRVTTAPSTVSEAEPGDSIFLPVGNNGWYPHGQHRALYDQQPIEAATMAETALTALTLLGKDSCRASFHRARAWFHGHNSLNWPLIDVQSGACCDGLQADGVNRNQGAESTLAYLWTEVQNHELQQTLSNERKAAVVSA